VPLLIAARTAPVSAVQGVSPSALVCRNRPGRVRRSPAGVPGDAGPTALLVPAPATCPLPGRLAALNPQQATPPIVVALPARKSRLPSKIAAARQALPPWSLAVPIRRFHNGALRLSARNM
jgi:hypothetical protein